MSPTGSLGPKLSLNLTCTSLSGGKDSVLVTWTFLASRRPIRSVQCFLNTSALELISNGKRL